MALASQTSRMTSNRSYMMSNVSRRKRRVQRRNLGVAILIVAGLVVVGGYMLSGGDDPTAPAVDTSVAGSSTPDRGAGSPLGPSTANAGLSAGAAERTREPVIQRSAALPDPEPVLRSEPDLRTTQATPARDEPSGAAVIEMGTPVVSAPEPRTEDPTSPTRDARSTTSASLPPTTSAGVSDLIGRADALVSQSKPLEARDILNRALFARTTTEAERETIRGRLTSINDTLVFSRAVAPQDPIVKSYSVGPGDSLARIAARENLKTDWRLISEINGISDPRRIRVGQSLKLIQGPFHAVVYKSRFRLDLFADATDSAGNRLYIRSFPVGLGEYGSTPEGAFVVRTNSKLINPVWTNPRTGEYFGADNPDNPIGEHWIGLDPADEASAEYTQYGLHGTIEPDSIGQNRSMGCVRLAAPDIELLYALLVEQDSSVEILP